jgi:hypothetical protein
MKAKAWLDIKERIAKGVIEDAKKHRKRKADVFRLAVILAESDVFVLPENIKSNLQTFVGAIAQELPDQAIFKKMGLGNMELERAFGQLKASFNLN